MSAAERLLHRTSTIRDMPEELLLKHIDRLSKEGNTTDLAIAREEARMRRIELPSTVIGD